MESPSALNDSHPGQVVISLSASQEATLTLRGTTSGDWFGYSTTLTTDLNDDDLPDLIIGSPRAGSGRAFVFHSPFDLSGGNLIIADQAAMKLQSPLPGDFEFGERVAPAADLTGDGIAELRVRAWYEGAQGLLESRTYFFDGATGAILFAIVGDYPADPWAPLLGDANGDGVVDQADIDLVLQHMGLQGESIGAYGDVNGDGVVDAVDLALVLNHLGEFTFSLSYDSDGVPHVTTADGTPFLVHLHMTDANDGSGGGVALMFPGFSSPCYGHPFERAEFVQIGQAESSTFITQRCCCDCPIGDPCRCTDCGPCSIDPCALNCPGAVCNPACLYNDPCCEPILPWPCDECCTVEIIPPNVAPVPGSIYTIETTLNDIIPVVWSIIEGSDRVVMLSDPTDHVLTLQLVESGPVKVRVDGIGPICGCDDTFSFMVCFDYDINGNGITDCCETILRFPPYNMNPFDIDLDSNNDGLHDWEEVCIYGTNPYFYDTDGDGLPDAWEILHGFDPLNPNDALQDWDGDGLTNFQEFMYDTDPNNWDTDGDGVSDGQEIMQGSNPLDPNDFEPADPADMVDVEMRVGDHSGSHSEFWMLRFTRRDTGQIVLAFPAPGYGQVTPWETERFRRGYLYDIELVHLGTNLDCNNPDYDYTAFVKLQPGTCGWIDDPENLFGIVEVNGGGCYGPSPNLAEGKTAMLFLPKIEVYDLRHWGPSFNGGEVGISNTNLYAGMGEQAMVDGAITDGASICLVRTVPDLQSIEGITGLENLSIIVRQVGQPEGASEVVGSLWEVDRQNVSLPPLPTMSGSTQVNFGQNVAFYVPPGTFHDPQFNGGSGLGSDETATIEFVIEKDNKCVAMREFELRRPPIILAHGLKSSLATWNGAIWDEGAFKTQITAIDYAPTNAAGYDTNWVHVRSAINGAIGDYRSGNIPNNPDGIRYAASRVDWVGHSMGGVLARLYASNWSGTAARKEGHSPITITRIPGTTDEYLNPENWYAGGFRRLITIGSPLDGSGLAFTGEAMKKLLAIPKKKSEGFGRVFDRFKGGLQWHQQWGDFGLTVTPTWEQIKQLLADDLASDWSNFDNALIDLQPGSMMQQLMDNGAYPTDHRRILWHPVVGIAHYQINPDQWKQVIWDGLFSGIDQFAQQLGLHAGSFNDANATNGDLVVRRESQVNGQPESVASLFNKTIHAGSIPGLDVQAETNHPGIAQKVHELLSKPATGNAWQGDITQ